MKKSVLSALAVLLALLAPVTSVPCAAATLCDGTSIHAISDLNAEETPLDDHGNDILHCGVELDLRESTEYVMKDFSVKSGYLWYPRVKKIAEDDYILFFQDGRWGPNVYYCKSTDGKTWGAAKKLFQSHSVQDGKYIRYYATCDAIVLQNGDIVAAAIFHPNTGTVTPSRFLAEEKGIVVRISHDNGLTWTDEKIVYQSRVWEPSFLQLPDGTLQMYLTHSGPKDMIYKTKLGSEVSSGVAMLTSHDNGETWLPDALSYPYEAKRIAQQKVKDYNGIAIMTDQMPVAILLHDNQTILMVAESATESGAMKMSVIRSHDFFETELTIDEVGPSDRSTNVLSGSGPFVVQFPSGEILMSVFASTRVKLYFANATGKKINTAREFVPLGADVHGLWSSMEVVDSHTVVLAAPQIIIEEGVKTNLKSAGLSLGVLRLNHNITAKTVKVTADGYTSDWSQNSDALFVGSETQAQVSVRAAQDGETLWILSERLDNDITKNDKVTVTLARADGKEQVKLTLDNDGISAVNFTDGKNPQKLDPADFACAVRVVGTVGNSADSDEGVVHEVGIPLSLFNLKEGEQIAVYVKLQNTDDGATAKSDAMDGCDETDKTNWPRITLSAEDATPAVTEPPRTEPPAVTASTPATTPDVTTGAPARTGSNTLLLVTTVAVCVAAAVAVCAAAVIIKARKK